MSVTLPQARTPLEPVDAAAAVRRRPRRRPLALALLALLALAQTALAYRPGYNQKAFIDEGLYVYIGHRMLDHVLHGAFLQEYPGAYLSGAPGFYPVLAALGDSVGGLQGARAVSLIGVIAATVCVFGLTRALFSEAAGLFAALAFAICGSVIYQSHLAVYDSTMMALVAGAGWLAVSSAKRDALAWAPAVGALLAAGFLAKYAGAVYTPVIAALAVAAGWPQLRWLVVRRAAFVVLSAVVMALFVLVLWGQSLWPGIRITTTDRNILFPASAKDLFVQAAGWVGPWVVLAVLGGAYRLRREWRVVAVLLVGSVIGVLQQIRIGDSTSLNKHVAFGLVFACPLIGDLAVRAVRQRRWVTVPATALVFAMLLSSGLHLSKEFLTSWVQDDTLLPPLRAAIALNPDKAVLAEEGSPERYALRDVLTPEQYGDTYALSYAGLTGDAAYKAAVDQTHYGTIYLSMTTDRGKWLYRYITRGHTPYRLTASAPRILRGEKIGVWLIYTPKVSATGATR